MRSTRALAAALLTFAALGAQACSTPAGTPSCAGAGLRVVAAENFWGSIAAQVAGSRACVTSVIRNPAVDPHDYDATPSDARLFASARYVIENGAGYDAWAARLLAGNPVATRLTLDVGRLVGVAAGGNPHLWYSPGYVDQVVARVARDLASLDPKDSAYFQSQAAAYESEGLEGYHRVISTIAERYHGAAVGASESVFVYMAQATGLSLATPGEFMKAISEGSDPSATDVATVQAQISGRQIKVWIFNSQNSTPQVSSLVALARQSSIPVVAVTETLEPAEVTFQDWQARQLRALLQALGG